MNTERTAKTAHTDNAETSALLMPSLNLRLGWLLVVAGFVFAAWLDPWSLQRMDADLPAFALRVAARQAQAATLSMAFLQLALGMLFQQGRLRGRLAAAAAWLTAIGAVLHAGGHALALVSNRGVSCIPLGALFNLIGCLLLARGVAGAQTRLTLLVLLTFAFGCFLNIVTGLRGIAPFNLWLSFLGPADDVRMRMLRLAQVAAIALPLLALLYDGFTVSSPPQGTETGWGRAGMFVGMIGMPLVLTLAAFMSVSLKYLLPIPALSIFGATVSGARLARHHASSLEFWGWALIALSMGVGLGMGLYAFNGPLPPPHFVGAYDEFARRLSRLSHAYCILLGLLSIFLARQRDTSTAMQGADGAQEAFLKTRLLVASIATTLLVIVLVAGNVFSVGWLRVGPALVAAATLLCLGKTRQTL